MRGYGDLPQDGSSPEGGATPAAERDEGEKRYLDLAARAYKSSTSWYEKDLRSKLDRNDRLFRSEHPHGSKYLDGRYGRRSTIFRPKTRGSMRKAEAQAAAAFFSTEDVVSVTANDDKNPASRAAALIGREVLNHRLNGKNKNSIPWFLTCIGALQDARKQGMCASKQWWEYRERKVKRTEAYTDEFGDEIEVDVEDVEVLADRPRCDLLPLENVRFDSGADWIDPVGTSPYLILLVPMYAGDVKARAESTDTKTTEPPWFEVTDAQLASAKVIESSSRDREKDQANRDNTVADHDIVWVHENHFRIDGEDEVWWTLGTKAMLSKPKPLKDVYWHGERPVILGRALIETHKTVPEGHVGMGWPHQREINDLVNLRNDALAFALAPVAKVRRGANVDNAAVTFRYPGKTISMRDPEGDVIWDRPPAPHPSGYQEEDRLMVSMDEIMGTFSPQSVNSNRNLNETVGGMQMLDSSAGTIGEYDLRTFAETWAEPVLTQLLKLEQAYETDDTVLTLAAEAGEVWDAIQIDPMDRTPNTIAQLMQEELVVKVNVGIGATDPQMQIQKFIFGFTSLMNIAGPLVQTLGPQVIGSPGFKAISEEIFGKLGYRDGARFLEFSPDGQDPMVAMAQQQIQELQGAMGEMQQREETKAAETEGKAALQQQAHQMKIQERAIDHDFQQQAEAQQFQRDMLMNTITNATAVNVM